MNNLGLLGNVLEEDLFDPHVVNLITDIATAAAKVEEDLLSYLHSDDDS